MGGCGRQVLALWRLGKTTYPGADTSEPRADYWIVTAFNLDACRFKGRLDGRFYCFV